MLLDLAVLFFMNILHDFHICRFLLGTEHRANLYILQYQELFAEDGRRPAAVVVVRKKEFFRNLVFYYIWSKTFKRNQN